MKVIFFVPQMSCGGAQQVAILLSSAFVKLGHEAIIAAPSQRGELVREIDPSCRFVSLGKNRPINSTKELSELVKTVNPDAVVCFGIYTGIAAAISKTLYRWQHVLLIRNENNLHSDWKQGSPLNRMIGPTLSRWAAQRTHLIAVSKSLAWATSSYLRITPAQVTTILNPVIDDTRPQSSITGSSLHPWLQAPSIPTFVAMGRLEYQKGFDVLIDAFSRLRNQTNARLVIFGTGSLHDALQAQIDAGGLQAVIALAGYTAKPMDQMGAAHAFVLSSRFEGFGLVLVEALWAGTRVISTQCDFGPAEILEDGIYGTLVPVDDPEALATAMLDSLNPGAIRQRPADAWFDKFTATAAARQHITLIESLH